MTRQSIYQSVRLLHFQPLCDQSVGIPLASMLPVWVHAASIQSVCVFECIYVYLLGPWWSFSSLVCSTTRFQFIGLWDIFHGKAVWISSQPSIAVLSAVFIWFGFGERQTHCVADSLFLSHCMSMHAATLSWTLLLLWALLCSWQQATGCYYFVCATIRATMGSDLHQRTHHHARCVSIYLRVRRSGDILLLARSGTNSLVTVHPVCTSLHFAAHCVLRVLQLIVVILSTV